MTLDEIKKQGEEHLFQNYGRLDVAFKSGSGMMLRGVDGKEYLDLVGGIAVCALGYSHPKWVAAVQEQVGRLVHVSNLYHIREQAEAAEKVASVTPDGLDKVLFVNSGAEANEAALKLAVRSTGRTRVLSALNSFHGRTAGALGATGQTKYQDTFGPLISDSYDYFRYNDEESLKEAVCPDTAAVIIEPIQGEGGVQVADDGFLRAVRDICSDNGALMIVDEVQTGFGRTGRWFGIQHSGVVPDVITMAKALGGGVPVGAIATTAELSKVLSPGTHGTTFGGNPLVTRAVSATIDIMKEERLVENSAKVGSAWMRDLASIDSPEIADVRGKGLIIGIEMKNRADEFRARCLHDSILVNVCHGNTVRLIPPLIASEKDAAVLTHELRGFLGC